MNYNHRNFWIVFIMSIFIISLMTILATADSGVSVSAKSAILYEPQTNKVLYSKNENERLPMASTTKIMTALIAIEQCDMEKVVSVPKEAVGIEGSSVYLKAEEKISIKDLIYSVLLRSANDAATVLAIEISGSVPAFADTMNEKAADIGLKNTHFENPHGLDSQGHYTSAYDLAYLTSYALKNEVFKNIVSTYKYTTTSLDSPRVLINHNKLLKRYSGAIGVKTGFTKKSGRCLVSAAERDGLSLICVTLDAPSDWSDHTKLLDFGYSSLVSVYKSSLSKTSFEVAIINGEKEFALCKIRNENTPIIKGKDETVTASINIKKYVVAPQKIGSVVGEIIYKVDNKIIEKDDIIVTEDIKAKKEKKHLFFINTNTTFKEQLLWKKSDCKN